MRRQMRIGIGKETRPDCVPVRPGHSRLNDSVGQAGGFRAGKDKDFHFVALAA